MRSYHTGLPGITSATLLPSSGLLALGSYSKSLLLIDPTTGRPAGSLPNIASTAALSLIAWPSEAAAVGAGGLSSSWTATAGGGGGGGGWSGSSMAAADGSSISRSGVVDVCRDMLAVSDADGSVRLMQLDVDSTVSF